MKKKVVAGSKRTTVTKTKLDTLSRTPMRKKARGNVMVAPKSRVNKDAKRTTALVYRVCNPGDGLPKWFKR